jgi:hypothetical protein
MLLQPRRAGHIGATVVQFQSQACIVAEDMMNEPSEKFVDFGSWQEIKNVSFRQHNVPK